MEHASYANQARVHTGYHYPRSLVTAAASLALHQRFVHDFSPCVDDSFTMLYAIAKHGSKISANHFWKTFEALKAPIEQATPHDSALFDHHHIDDVFAVQEHAFNARILRTLITEKLQRAGVEVAYGEDVHTLTESATAATIHHRTSTWDCEAAFLTIYDHTNALLTASGFPGLGIKNERAEICLVEPPSCLRHKGVTVMDGPFFSCMPFPAQQLHSLTHVRYTPRSAWTEPTHPPFSNEGTHEHSSFPWMMRDSARYLPCMRQAQHRTSLFVTKAVLLRNEHNDGRPIALETFGEHKRVHAVLGGKIDNIYDLFDALPGFVEGCEGADMRYISTPSSNPHNHHTKVYQ